MAPQFQARPAANDTLVFDSPGGEQTIPFLRLGGSEVSHAFQGGRVIKRVRDRAAKKTSSRIASCHERVRKAPQADMSELPKSNSRMVRQGRLGDHPRGTLAPQLG